jgi:CPA1 family monovalent cation:H+ antiporter
MSARTEDALALVWEFLAFLLTALVFLLVGLAIAIPSLIEALPAIAWAVLAIVIARILVVYVLLGGGSRLRAAVMHREPIPTPWLHVLFWAGLRGAVAVAMALSLPIDFPARSLLQEITFGVVLFTLLVQGLSIDVVVRRVLGPKASRRAEGVSPAG